MKPDEGVAIATPRRDERLAAETIAVGAEYGVFGHALSTSPNFSKKDRKQKIGMPQGVPVFLF